jgi:3-deoxy-D-manno-octulosonate 8-phosphate phosphatase (KDO 8-P phosphatase)
MTALSDLPAEKKDLSLAAAKARELEWMFFDIDGVMTDGGLFYGEHGEELKRFHVLDGHGIKALRSAGLKIALLSGRQHPANQQRAKELGIDLVIQGESNKGAAFDRLVASLGLRAQRCGHMGDDVPDLEVFERVGFAAAVPNAMPAVRAAAHWIAQRPGGYGAVRECCDFILESRR